MTAVAEVTQKTKKKSFEDLVKASTLNLADYEGRAFMSQKNHKTTYVKLDSLTRRDVQLSYTGDRVDKFSLSRAKFGELYRLVD
jgi:ABC-type uncharacterized transport system ATPase component